MAMAMHAEWWASSAGALATSRTASASCRGSTRPRPFFRHSARDAWLCAASVAQAALTLAAFALAARAGSIGVELAAAFVFGIGVCWCSNTVSHNHLHNPLFQSRAHNRAFSLWLTVLLGVPQTIWRARHLWHHAGEPVRGVRKLSARAWLEIVLVGVIWVMLFAISPRLFLFSYVPGYLLGMALCRLQGDMEHADGATRGVSYYGKLYNVFWFNDGHHTEHHKFPSEHWTRLPARRAEVAATVSQFPPHLRFVPTLERVRGALSALKGYVLCRLERLALRFDAVRSFVLATHERALTTVLADLPEDPHSVVVIGGGLFPRSVILLARLFPRARFSVVDQSPVSVSLAIEELKRQGFDLSRVRFVIERFDPARHLDHDLVVAPLGFVGPRALLDGAASAVPLLSHDWIWQRRGSASRVVSWFLLKRVNLALPAA